MKRTSLHDYPCSIARALDAAGEWWTPLILRDIAYGVRRFREIQEDLGISANVLSDRLEGLIAQGLAQTRIYQSRPVRHEYFLTEKGLDLVPALLALMSWGDKWAWQTTGGPVRVFHEGCDHEVSVEIRCAHCDQAVEPLELRAKPSGRFTSVPHEHEPGHLSAQRLMGADGVKLGD